MERCVPRCSRDRLSLVRSLIIGYGLPAGWVANLISHEGVLLAGSSMGARAGRCRPSKSPR